MSEAVGKKQKINKKTGAVANSRTGDATALIFMTKAKKC